MSHALCVSGTSTISMWQTAAAAVLQLEGFDFTMAANAAAATGGHAIAQGQYSNSQSLPTISPTSTPPHSPGIKRRALLPSVGMKFAATGAATANSNPAPPSALAGENEHALGVEETLERLLAAASSAPTTTTTRRRRKGEGHKRNHSISLTSWKLPKATPPALLDSLITLAPPHAYAAEEMSHMQSLLLQHSSSPPANTSNAATNATTSVPSTSTTPSTPVTTSTVAYHPFVTVQLTHLPPSVSVALGCPTLSAQDGTGAGDDNGDGCAGGNGTAAADAVEIAARVDCSACFMVRAGGGFYLCGPVAEGSGTCNCCSCGAILDIDLCTQTNLVRGSMAHLLRPRNNDKQRSRHLAAVAEEVQHDACLRAAKAASVLSEAAAAKAAKAEDELAAVAAATAAAERAYLEGQAAAFNAADKEHVQKDAAALQDFQTMLLESTQQQEAADPPQEYVAVAVSAANEGIAEDTVLYKTAARPLRSTSKLKTRKPSTIRASTIALCGDSVLHETLAELATSVARAAVEAFKLDVAAATILALLVEEVAVETAASSVRSARLAGRFRAMPRSVAGAGAGAGRQQRSRCDDDGLRCASTHHTDHHDGGAGPQSAAAAAASRLCRRQSSQVVEYLHAFELIPQYQLDYYKEIFNAIDVERAGMLTSEQLRIAIAAAVQSMGPKDAVLLAAAAADARIADDTSGSDVDRLLSGLTGEVLDAVQQVAEVQPDLTPTNFQLFAIIAAMVEKIGSPRTAGFDAICDHTVTTTGSKSERSGWWKQSTSSLILQLQRARDLFFLCEVDSFGTIDVDEIGQKLSAAGQPTAAVEFEEVLEEMRSRHGGWGRLSFLDFLDYLPFFAQLHADIVARPFTSNGNSDWDLLL